MADDKLWAAKGFEIAAQQFELATPVPAIINSSQGDHLTLNESTTDNKVRGSDFSMDFDKTKGTFTKIEKDGENILRNQDGPVLYLWRAPHQQNHMWVYRDWMKNRLRLLHG